jgi:hypothetical protein
VSKASRPGLQCSIFIPRGAAMAVSTIPSLACALALAAAAGAVHAQASAPATIRVDYLHSGNALSDSYAIERVLVEPLPWPGDLAQNLDNTDRGRSGRCQDRRPDLLARLLDHLRGMAHHR